MDPTNEPAPQPSATVAPSVTAVGASLQQAVATPSTTVTTAGASTGGAAPQPKQAAQPDPRPAAQQQADPQPQQAAGPDESQKLARIERERDDYKAKWEAAQAAEAAKADLEAQLADARKRAAVDVALASRGCLSLQMARTAVDFSKIEVKDDGTVEGFDAEAFVAANPFLFQPQPAAPSATVSTGAPQGGPEPVKEARTIKEALAATRKERS